MENKNVRTIGVLTSGGDAPGMNAAIRSVVRVGSYYGLKVFGVRRGYNGLINGELEEMNARSVSEILQRGGTILQTARCLEFKEEAGVKKAVEIAKVFGLDGLVVVGGDGPGPVGAEKRRAERQVILLFRQVSLAVLRLFLFLKESGVLTKTYFVLFLRVNQEEESTLLLSLPKVSAVLLKWLKKSKKRQALNQELLFLVMFKEAAVRQFVTELWQVKWVVRRLSFYLKVSRTESYVCNNMKLLMLILKKVLQ